MRVCLFLAHSCARSASNEWVSWVQSRSQSFVPLDQRSENVSSGSNHYERTKEITEFWLSGSLRICIYGACLKWLLPELTFSDRWSRGTKLWERDWSWVCKCSRKLSVDGNLWTEICRRKLWPWTVDGSESVLTTPPCFGLTKVPKKTSLRKCKDQQYNVCMSL